MDSQLVQEKIRSARLEMENIHLKGQLLAVRLGELTAEVAKLEAQLAAAARKSSRKQEPAKTAV
ncbi:hypothetical protein [Burkholderia vietnamiensis]|uniref:hypothetical protein n=1 Tax=Burkholderia vietnamiensis TaxID=60552 RepID=UPI00075BDF19|nr:hypothetical protein [Burkholderia vietnamiensis]KVE71445.1 hypothetical protein WI98_25380 [Burkholderia vietnamiensis]